MQLSYIEMLSPEPLVLNNIGTLKPITLRTISRCFMQYQTYLSIALMTPEKYYGTIQQSEEFEKMSLSQKSELHIFDLLISNEDTIVEVENMLQFFLVEFVQFDFQHKFFMTYNEGQNSQDHLSPIGIINKAVWNDLCNIILQMNYVEKQIDDFSEIKSSRAKQILEKLLKGRKKKQQVAPNEHIDLGNVISAVASQSESLNINNIWDLTVYQLWDQYSRLRRNTAYNLQARNVSIWGDKNNKFDIFWWCKPLE